MARPDDARASLLSANGRHFLLFTGAVAAIAWVFSAVGRQHSTSYIPATAVVSAPSSPFVPTVANESEWSPQRIPSAWPKFTVVPGKKRPPKVSAEKAISTGRSIIDRWDRYKIHQSSKRPTMTELDVAIDQMLTIDPRDSKFPEAWGVFIRLRQVDREIAAHPS